MLVDTLSPNTFKITVDIEPASSKYKCISDNIKFTYFVCKVLNFYKIAYFDDCLKCIKFSTISSLIGDYITLNEAQGILEDYIKNEPNYKFIIVNEIS